MRKSSEKHHWAHEEINTPTLGDIEDAERQAERDVWCGMPFEERCRRVNFDFDYVNWMTVHTPRPAEQAAEGFCAFFPRTLPLNNDLFAWDNVTDCWRELNQAVLYEAVLATNPTVPMAE